MSSRTPSDSFLTIRLPRLVVDRIDRLRVRLASRVDGEVEGVRITRTGVVERALNAFEVAEGMPTTSLRGAVMQIENPPEASDDADHEPAHEFDHSDKTEDESGPSPGQSRSTKITRRKR